MTIQKNFRRKWHCFNISKITLKEKKILK